MTIDEATANSLLAALESHAMALGVFDAVNGHEPKAKPGQGLAASFWLQRIGPAIGFQSGLAATTALLVWQSRLTINMMYEPQDAIDPKLMGAASSLYAEYAGAFTLGGLCRCVDLRGMAGVPLSCDAGYMTQDNTAFRAYTMTIPLIIDDAWAETA